MAAEKGLEFLLKIGATVVAGLRATAFTINGEEVDVTTKDSPGGWRELLAEAGVIRRFNHVSCVFPDNANLAELQVSAIAKTQTAYSILFESGDDDTGQFQVTSIEQSGEFNGEVTYSPSLESSGEIVFTSV